MAEEERRAVLTVTLMADIRRVRRQIERDLDRFVEDPRKKIILRRLEESLEAIE